MTMEENMEIVQENEETIELCRVCDESHVKMHRIFQDNEESYQLIGWIKETLPIVLYKSDPLSKVVCDSCMNKLQLISSLKKLSRKTQDKYVDKLKSNADVTDKNVLLFLGCTGNKLIENGGGNQNEEEEEEEFKDQSTSCDDLTILCANCNDRNETTVLQEAISDSLKRNRVVTGDDSEKVLRRRRIPPVYQELDDSLCSSLTDLPPGGDSEASEDEEQVAKRSKLDSGEEEHESTTDGESSTSKTEEQMEMDRLRLEEIKQKCSESFREEPVDVYEPLTLMELVINHFNTKNVEDHQAVPYKKSTTWCKCKVCNEDFQNTKLLALHESAHMEVDAEQRVDGPELWPDSHPFAKTRNGWLTRFDEPNEVENNEEVVENDEEEEEEEDEEEDTTGGLLVENPVKTEAAASGNKDEITLVNMKPMVNGLYLGDYTKEERKAFYQCMRIGGQTKRFCPLCRYCFKDNWAIESHYFSFACFYTCRHCGMRFNKQRHRFEEHVEEHQKREDKISEKIYTASKVHNTMPKIVQPDRVRKILPMEPEQPREILLDDYSKPPVITKGGFDQRTKASNQNGVFNHGNSTKFPMKIKEEPRDDMITASSAVSSGVKPQNQAYFCRKCYKVFFKLDEFNAHSKNCDYNNFTVKSNNQQPTKPVKVRPDLEISNGDVSNAGRPMRNCAKDIGPYKDEVYIPKQILNETLPSGPSQSFICHICGTPFPTIYSRNSHMRIHKGEVGTSPHQQNLLKQRLQQQNMRQRQQVRVKEEPVDQSFEPMVEIHEEQQEFNTIPQQLGGGAVSLTPIVKKPALNPNILKLVQNNPNISLVAKKPTSSTSTTRQINGGEQRAQVIKNAGGYQGPYAPSNNNQQRDGSYVTVPSSLLLNEENKSYKCSSCWEAFTNKSHLYFHKKNQCEGSRFPCPFCKKRFGTEAAYSSHIFYSHPE